MDAEFQPIYCRWAESQWPVGPVAKVYFDIGTHGPYSEWTPDVDAYVAVDLTLMDGSRCSYECDLGTLINGVTQMAARTQVQATETQEKSG